MEYLPTIFGLIMVLAGSFIAFKAYKIIKRDQEAEDKFIKNAEEEEESDSPKKSRKKKKRKVNPFLRKSDSLQTVHVMLIISIVMIITGAFLMIAKGKTEVIVEKDTETIDSLTVKIKEQKKQIEKLKVENKTQHSTILDLESKNRASEKKVAKMTSDIKTLLSQINKE